MSDNLDWEREEWQAAQEDRDAFRAIYRRFAGGIEIVGDKEDSLDGLGAQDMGDGGGDPP
jgi:hypothetical protein